MRRTIASILLLLSLLLGGLGCSSLKSEKRIRHAIRADYSVQDPQFRISMSHLLGAPLVDGNNVVELLNGDQIFPAMLEAIRYAQKTITLEQYIWKSDEVGTQFVKALSERAQAGVKVHIIADTFGSFKLAKSDVDQMKKAGVEFEDYNYPLPFKIFRINHRTHRKLMVVDGKIGFTGGACLADEWLGNAEPGRWRETHFRVEGPVVGQMQAVFMDNWQEMSSEVLHGQDYFPQIKPSGSMIAQCFMSGPQEGTENARLTYSLSIAAAQKNIRIAHAYFVPSRLLIDALLEARRRGVKIEIIVAGKLDHFPVKNASRSRWAELLEAGAEFYEYQPTLYHCKIMIVDDVWTTAGSVNFDERSFRINDEANLNVLDRGFASKLIKTFEDDKSKSRLLTYRDFKNRNWFRKFSEHFMGLFQSQF